jgi:hypothetical protein
MKAGFACALVALAPASMAIAAPTHHHIDFDELNIGDLVDDQYAASDFVDFAGTGVVALLSGGDEEIRGLELLQPTTIAIDVVPGYTLSNFVFDLEIRKQQLITVQLFDENGLVASDTYQGGNFFSFELIDDITDFSSYSGITGIRIFDTGLTFRVDDLNFDMTQEGTAVPLPTAAGLASVGLGLTAARRRRAS